MDMSFGLANIENGIKRSRQLHALASPNSHVAKRIEALENLVLELARDVAKMDVERRR